MKRSSSSLCAGLLGTVSLAVCLPAFAQVQESPEETELRAETVIVSATRREADAQTIPVAVTAVSEQDIVNAGIRDTTGLQQLAPSLVVTVSNSETTGGVIRIRGVGTAGQNPGLEGAVGAFVDGVYRSRPGLALNDLLDVQQVEVLRGPQGTLFGKNTSAGAIVITTRKPEFEFGGEVMAGLGSDGQQRLMGVITGPVVADRLAFRLSGLVNRRDGYIEDVNSGADYNDRDRYSLRAQLLAEPTENLSLRLIADYIEKDEVCCAAPYVRNGTRGALITSLGGTVFDPTREDDLVVAINTVPRSEVEEAGLSGHLDWALPLGQLKIIASTRTFNSARDSDVDNTDLDLANINNDVTKDRLNTLEATLQGETGRIDWLVGAYAFESTLNNPQTQVMGSDLGAFLGGVLNRPAVIPLYREGDGDLLRRFYQEGDGWSVFTHNTISLTDALKLTLGVRYLEESKTGGGQFVTQLAPSCTSPLVPAAARVYCATRDYEAEFSDSALTYTAAVSYQLTSNLMGYGSFSKGYKAGGISLDRDAGNRSSQTFLPEESENYELGLRTEWFDNRVRANLTAFRIEFTDFQRNVFTGTETLLSNQGEVISQGVEFESRFQVSQALNINASVTYADTQYGEDVSDAAIAGRRLNAAPMWTGQLGGSYSRPLTDDLTFFLSGAARYQSATVTGADLDPLKRQEGYTLVNGRIGLALEAHDAEIALWGSNLLDESYRVITFNAALQPGSLAAFMGEPRAWGVEVSKRF